ncbi:tyrosine-type recombinase/integrase [Citrobacter koseri]|uniref:tyrosine-type DNA invertase n=1 Tax=Citrobacter koseri TaxID=545 RepID=UPI0018E1A912|nr:tyrosine-type DNA invertase [Citrobacter koseri]MBI0676611.1 tyrosine-type recombinase/integrase [Citrobacter koseri]
MKRRHLTGNEVEKLLATILKESNSHRDYCMIMMAFIHGLRVSELISLKIEDYDPLSRQISIHRLKGGLSTIHPVLPEEYTVLQRWIKERKHWAGSEEKWLFLSRKGGKLSRQRIYHLVRHYGFIAKLPLPVHPHMLRHACGYNLADRGNDTRLIQDYLGHRNIRHTVRYTAANSGRFINAWRQDVIRLFKLTE